MAVPSLAKPTDGKLLGAATIGALSTNPVENSAASSEKQKTINM